MISDPNRKFRILKYMVNRAHVRVYILNPGDRFIGFGGSRHDLPISKTASLIISESDYGRCDIEYNVNDKNAWAAIRRGLCYRYQNHDESSPTELNVEPHNVVPTGDF